MTLKKFIDQYVGFWVKRAITLGAGYAVAKGVLPQFLFDQFGEEVTLAVTGLVLTGVYAAYDKYAKAWVQEFLGLPSAPSQR